MERVTSLSKSRAALGIETWAVCCQGPSNRKTTELPASHLPLLGFSFPHLPKNEVTRRGDLDQGLCKPLPVLMGWTIRRGKVSDKSGKMGMRGTRALFTERHLSCAKPVPGP